MPRNAQTLEAGAQYMRRRDMSPARSSSLFKLVRGARIAAGQRPQRMPRQHWLPIREAYPGVIVERLFELHPTKGFRRAPGVEDRFAA